MRALALDWGQTRVGLAVSDPAQKVATPLCVLAADDVAGIAPVFRRLLEDWEPGLLVCGLPLSLDGSKGSTAASVEAQARALSAKTGIALELVDERLSSAQAKRSLREKGMSEREMRGKIDMIAAALFLQAWLDARAARNAHEKGNERQLCQPEK